MSGEIHAAVNGRDVERLRRAIAAGGDVNERARPLQITPLHVAARYGYPDCITILLDSGADVNAKGQYGTTSLYTACDYKQISCARLLITRGASANIHGERGRTPLHVAIKRGLTGIVREMLDAGAADPSIPSLAGDHDTQSYVKRSSASKSERQELTELLPQYVSLETAVATGKPNVIEAIVKRAFMTTDVTTALVVYLNAVPHHTGLGEYRMRLLVAMLQANRPDLFHRVLYSGQSDAATVRPRDLLDRTRFEGDQIKTTALHLAAFYGHTQSIEFFVNECDLDPEIVDALGRRPIQLVTDTRDHTGRVRALLAQLAQQRRFRRFTRQLLIVTGPESSAMDPENAAPLLPQLEQLTETMSSVRDVRVLFNVGAATLSEHPEQFKRLLTRAFTQLIQDKLVVDDREALVFKMVLRECERRGLLSETEVEHWDMQLVKVNMESAAWVKELKQSLHQIQWRIDDVDLHAQTLRLQYDQLSRAIQQARASGVFSRTLSRLRSVLSLFSVILSLAGVDGASQVLDTVVDLSEPLNTLAETYIFTVEEQLTAYVDDPETAGTLQVRATLVPVLQRAGIDPNDLAQLLREAVLLEREQNPQNTSQKRQIDSQETPSTPPTVVLPEPTKRASVKEPESDLEQFPYHYAVKHSGGDLEAFLNVVEFIEEDPTASTQFKDAVVAIPRLKRTVRATPAILASYLGYVSITKYFLNLGNYPTSSETEKKFVTIQRAHTMLERAVKAA